MFSIYRVRNRVNGKLYYGKTSRGLGWRWRQHQYQALIRRSTYHFHSAIRKYGPNSFDISLVRFCASEKEANVFERLCILLNSSHESEKGYNLTLGGEGMLFSEETKKKISQRMKGRKRKAGFKHSEETRKRMSETRKGKKHRGGWKHSSKVVEEMKRRNAGEGNPMFGKPGGMSGKKLSEEARRKISEANKRRWASEEARKTQSMKVKATKALRSGTSVSGASPSDQTEAPAVSDLSTPIARTDSAS